MRMSVVSLYCRSRIIVILYKHGVDSLSDYLENSPILNFPQQRSVNITKHFFPVSSSYYEPWCTENWTHVSLFFLQWKGWFFTLKCQLAIVDWWVVMSYMVRSWCDHCLYQISTELSFHHPVLVMTLLLPYDMWCPQFINGCLCGKSIFVLVLEIYLLLISYNLLKAGIPSPPESTNWSLPSPSSLLLSSTSWFSQGTINQSQLNPGFLTGCHSSIPASFLTVPYGLGQA